MGEQLRVHTRLYLMQHMYYLMLMCMSDRGHAFYAKGWADMQEQHLRGLQLATSLDCLSWADEAIRDNPIFPKTFHNLWCPPSQNFLVLLGLESGRHIDGN